MTNRMAVCGMILMGLTACQEESSPSADANLSQPTLSAKSSGEVALDEIVNAAQRLIKVQLTDPYSAQFDKMRTNATRDVLCGEVNSKNQAGGYAGARDFVYDSKSGEALIWPYAGSPDTSSMNEFELKEGIADTEKFTAAYKRCGYDPVQALPDGSYKAS